jgi:hypothetical protein
MAVAHPTSRPIRSFTVPPVDAMIADAGLGLESPTRKETLMRLVHNTSGPAPSSAI